MYVPRGVSRPIAAGEQIPCARSHCGRNDHAPGVRAHRWAPRWAKGPAIELCPRCHNELATIIAGG